VLTDADGDHSQGSSALVDPAGVSRAVGTGTSDGGAASGAIPALSSRPSAPANLYLNFGGDTVSNWLGYSPGAIPAYNGDGTAMTEIWQLVAENYSPFNINVTTVKPTDGEVAQIDIGGNGAWTGGASGGIAAVGGMGSSSASNPALGFVFPVNLGNGSWEVADASSHESGHIMGLFHQSSWSGSTEVSEYQSGPGDGTSPTMGESYGASRSMWWYGLNAFDVYQDDMSVIAGNSFGYVPSDTGTTPATAHALSASGGGLSASGVLTSMSQTDYWSFTTGDGALSFTVSDPYSPQLGATYGNLHPELEITDVSGNVVVGWQDPDSPSVSWTGSLPAGSYRIVVGSHGISGAATASNYGFDVGSYAISGTCALPGVPTGVTAAPGASQVTVAWNGPGGATGYNLYRATTSGTETLYQTGISTPSYTDLDVIDGMTYYYEVSAINAGGETAPSGEVAATPIPPPRVISPASASPGPVMGTSTSLSVSGSSSDGEPLSYAWSVTGEPAGARPGFGVGGTTVDDTNTTAVAFDTAGTYTFQVLLSTPSNLTVTSSVTVVVNQTETRIGISPATATVSSTASRQFSATALDQFGHALARQPSFTWSVDAGGAGSTIGGNGLYIAPATTNDGLVDTIRARDATASGTASVTVIVLAAAPTNLVATGVSTTQINLPSTDNATDETSYSVERSTGGTTSSVIATLAASNTGDSSTGLGSGSPSPIAFAASTAERPRATRTRRAPWRPLPSRPPPRIWGPRRPPPVRSS
jgi:hypothetical protein